MTDIFSYSTINTLAFILAGVWYCGSRFTLRWWCVSWQGK